MPPRHTSGCSGGGSLQPQPSPNQCYASHFRLAQQARTRIAGHLSKARPLPSNLHPKEQKAIKNLREADSIVIALADKGNATAVMDRNDSDGMIRTLMADADTYKRLPKDPTPTMERQMNALLLALARSGTMSDSPCNWLHSSAGN